MKDIAEVVYDALIENDGYYPNQLAEKIVDALRAAGRVTEVHVPVRLGDPSPSCQHYRIDNQTGKCEACGEQMVRVTTNAKTVLSAPNAAPCRDPQHLAAMEAGEDFECHHPYVPDHSRAKTVVIGYEYSYECERCRNNGTVMRSGEPIEWDCGHRHQGQFVSARG